jgi:hypothetical protein
MGGVFNADEEMVVNAKSKDPGLNEETKIASIGVTTETMAAIAQASIIESEKELSPDNPKNTVNFNSLRLPGNRRARRKLMKSTKIPKAFIAKGTLAQANAFTLACQQNKMYVPFEKKGTKKVQETEKI